MTKSGKIEATDPMLIAGVFMTSGVQDVIRELQKHKGAAQLTGFGLAMAVADMAGAADDQQGRD